VCELRQALTAESRSGTGTPAHPASTPYWTTFELRSIDMKVASVGVLGQIGARLAVVEPPEKPGRFKGQPAVPAGLST